MSKKFNSYTSEATFECREELNTIQSQWAC